MAFHYAVPNDTNRQTRHVMDCGNLGLVLDKYQPWDFVLGNSNRKMGETKSRWFKELTSDKHQENLFHNQLIDRFRQRWEAIVAGSQRLELWTATPLLVGLGVGGTLETGMTLHSLYGFPIIPATTLKGVARARIFYALAQQLGIPGLTNEQIAAYKKKPTPFQLFDQLLEMELDDKNKAAQTILQQLQANPQVNSENGFILTMTPGTLGGVLDENGFQAVFGSLSQAGAITFFDAIPLTMPKIEVDIMNPHYADYYGEGNSEAPHEGHSRLNPVTYLAVQSGTQFAFAVKARAGYADELAQKAAAWLGSGLINLGVGGKTSSGYGLMTKTEPLGVSSRQHHYYDRGG